MPALPALRRTLDYIGLSKPAVDHDVDRIGDFGTTVARMHDDEQEVGPLNRLETLRMRRIRLFGTTGSMLILIGSLGTGMLPVLQNPIVGMRILSLP
ncbi:MAG: hypothetical protein WBG39_05000, partial [Gordonia sp. (in: high G+C Gram-positive bacteria)]